MLRRAGMADADAIVALLAAAGADLVAQGFRNWERAYPIDRMQADIEERAVFLATDEGEAVATFTIGQSAVRAYDPAPWPDTTLCAAYLNRMAVTPARQGTGLGRWLLDAIDREASALGATAIRCDVIEANARLCRLYERHGYRACGTRDHSGWHFRCYERRLAT